MSVFLSRLRFSPVSCFLQASTNSLACVTIWRVHENVGYKRVQWGSLAPIGRGALLRSRQHCPYKIPPHFSISFNTNQTFARLPDGNFVTPGHQLTGQLCGFTLPFVFKS